MHISAQVPFTLETIYNCTKKIKKDAFDVPVSDLFDGVIKGKREGTPEDAPKYALSDRH